MKSHRRPVWDIYGVDWQDHPPNPRFAVIDPGNAHNNGERLVLDKETRLLWEGAPLADKRDWDAAILMAFTTARGNRKGWRLPAMEELLSLADPTKTNPTLPSGHPFTNVQLDDFYWSSTLGMSSLPTYAWGYNFGNGDTSNVLKSTECYVWLVRGGYGHDYPY